MSPEQLPSSLERGHSAQYEMQSGLDARSITQATSAVLRAKLAITVHAGMYPKSRGVGDLGVPFVFAQKDEDSPSDIEDTFIPEQNGGGTAVLGEEVEETEDDPYGLFPHDLSRALVQSTNEELQNALEERTSTARHAIVQSQLAEQYAVFEDHMNATYTPKQQQVLHISEGLYEGTLEQRISHARFMITAGLLEVLRQTHDYEPIADTINNLLRNA